jgi:gamma-glutamyl hercynylcysteine S-oxide synthase
MIHSKHKFFLKDLSSIFNSDSERIALEWERNSVRGLIDSREFDREEIAWYQQSSIEGFCFFYDTSTYNHETGQYTIEAFLDDGEKEFGGYDVIILWQPFPRIGIDQRNQFDFWRDMPGGLEGLRNVVARAHNKGVRCLVNYVPWDEGTRQEEVADAQAIAEIVRAIDADGIFGDTMPGFPPEFYEELKQVGSHLVLESESVPMFEGIQRQVGVWIQDIVLHPMLVPLPRWIEPRFKCFGVNRQLEDRQLLIAWSFFMGMGLVVWENVFGWWNPFNGQDRAMIRRMKPLLKANSDAFMDANWQPLPVPDTPGLFANLWKAGDKTVVTLLNMTNEPINKASIFIPQNAGFYHYFDVWNGCTLDTKFPKGEATTVQVIVDIDPQSPGCIVALPTTEPIPPYAPEIDTAETTHRTHATVKDHLPKAIQKTAPANLQNIPDEMVLIPEGLFHMEVYDSWVYNRGGCYDSPGNYGNHHLARDIAMPVFLMDRTEVTNAQFYDFLQATNYQPKEPHNFLQHWTKPDGDDSSPSSWQPPAGKTNHPVVWVDLDDARAFSQWAGKRLPTEAEWQYAAQGTDGRKWPWGEEFDPEKCNSGTDDTTPVGHYPQGVSPFGCLDMAGNVWEWTESERDDGHTRYAILKSGSYWVAQGSLWYVASGAQPCNAHQKILLMYPGLDRCATIGVRCVRDANPNVANSIPKKLPETRSESNV